MKHYPREVMWRCAVLAAIGCGGGSQTNAVPGTVKATPVGTAAGASAGRGSGAAGQPVLNANAAAASLASGRGASGVAALPAGAAGAGVPAAGVGAGSAGLTTAGTGPSAAGTTGTSSTAGAAGSAAVGGSGSGGASASASAPAGMSAPSSPAQTLPPITDYTQPGPFKTTVEANTGPDKNYTIYRPDPLGTDGFVHAPIVFGPGIATSCAPGGGLNIYTALLDHFSSHGFVTICVNSLSGGPGDPANVEAMQKGLEWIIAQNSQPGTFQGKLAVDRAVAMGYSIGAGGSVKLASHPAVMTTVVIHDHNTSGDPHGPVLMITGTMDVIDDMRATFKTLDEAPSVLIALPIGHLDVISEIAAGGRYIAPITAWLRYWVNGDQGAKHFFFGDSCDVCKSPWITPEPNDKWKALM